MAHLPCALLSSLECFSKLPSSVPFLSDCSMSFFLISSEITPERNVFATSMSRASLTFSVHRSSRRFVSQREVGLISDIFLSGGSVLTIGVPWVSYLLFCQVRVCFILVLHRGNIVSLC